jgi:feruloyl esterase
VTRKSTRWGGDGTNPNLKTFVNVNHKLMMYHGWSDPALTAYISVNYYNDVQATLGSVTNNVRLFMIPGMHHCGGGPGPDQFDTLTPLVTWVEQGIAPDGLLATHQDATGATDRTMPLCAYPELPAYIGAAGGPYNDCSTWTCSTSGVSCTPAPSSRANPSPEPALTRPN